MEYFEVGKKELVALMDGLVLIERVSRDNASELSLYLYGVTNDPTLLGEAKAAIIDSAEDYWDEEGNSTLSDEDVSLPEIAIAIPLSADTLYTLLGSGLDNTNLTFAYNTGGGEGARTSYFQGPYRGRVRITLQRLSKVALAEEDFRLRDFLAEHGSGQLMAIQKKTQRTEPAVAPTPAPPNPTAAASTENIKASSIRQVLENFLG